MSGISQWFKADLLDLLLSLIWSIVKVPNGQTIVSGSFAGK